LNNDYFERMSRSINLLLCFFLFISFSSFAQSKDSLIRMIKTNFQTINADTSLKEITLQDDEFLEEGTDGGAELTGFYKNNSLVKIVEWIGLSTGNRTREYYFKDGSLFFAYEQFDAFVLDKKGEGLDHGKTKTVFEGRYYFNSKKLIEQKIKTKKNAALPAVGPTEIQSAAADDITILKKKISS
jgi:hypothetical protein